MGVGVCPQRFQGSPFPVAVRGSHLVLVSAGSFWECEIQGLMFHRCWVVALYIFLFFFNVLAVENVLKILSACFV